MKKADIPMSRWRAVRRRWKQYPNFMSFRQAMKCEIGQYWATRSIWAETVSF